MLIVPIAMLHSLFNELRGLLPLTLTESDSLQSVRHVHIVRKYVQLLVWIRAGAQDKNQRGRGDRVVEAGFQVERRRLNEAIAKKLKQSKNITNK